ncbi:MAG: PAS domain-containing protein [Spirochaetales bacterium]|nr:PAS domain-containing protein [Spirochaetales bacterium]
MNEDLKKKYSIIVEFLGNALGPDYEVVLHDTEDHINSIVAIANGQVSGREVGGPLTNFGLEVISDESYKSLDYKLNYNGVLKDKRILRSSSMFIKDDDQNVTGMLCINFDDRRYKEIGENLLRLCHPDALIEINSSYDSVDSLVENAGERFYDSVSEDAYEIIQGYLTENGKAADNLTHSDRQKIVDVLNYKGIFNFKGAVREVAKQLTCSEPSIYRYLNKSNND